jgi:putative ABC transport system permease protein
VLFRAITERAGRVVVASFAVTIAVAIIVSAFGISSGIRKKLGQELKAYGANIIVSRPGGGLVEENVRKALDGVSPVEGYSLQLYATLQVRGVTLELMGMELERALGWKVQGRLPGQGAGEALLGLDVSAALGLGPGDVLSAVAGEKEVALTVTGSIERGGPEDGAVMVTLADAQEIAGRPGEVSAALVRAEPGSLARAMEAIGSRLPGSEVRTLRQVAEAEESFLAKIELLMALVSIVVLAAASISLSSTMSATVLERLKEIGLMKAIGGTRRGIGAFFLSEGAVIGLIGGVVGYLVGVFAAQLVSRGAFGSFVPVPPLLIVLALSLGVMISVSASLAPLVGALRHRPSVILRGE